MGRRLGEGRGGRLSQEPLQEERLSFTVSDTIRLDLEAVNPPRK